MASYKVVIPARYASSRLPGKPLLDIAGKPMIQHVYERAAESGAEEILVATDDPRVADAVRAFGGEACLTSPAHHSGTDRLAEVAAHRQWPDEAILVNLQGDEPGMPAQLLDQVAADMAEHPSAAITTLSTPISERETLFDPHVVKVVTDAAGFALYFSRAPVPWCRDAFSHGHAALPSGVAFARHIGLYAYRAGFLRRYVTWPPAPIEQAEALEQLRVLWNGERIHVRSAAKAPGHGIDTPQDLERARRLSRVGSA